MSIPELKFFIDNVPALLLGDDSDNLYLFVHGKSGSKEEARLFAEIACPEGWQVLGIDLPSHGERINESDGFNPWSAVPELKKIMKFVKVNEERLKSEKIIQTEFGETLSWEYFVYAKEHEIKWNSPTKILYAGHDNLTDRKTVDDFVNKFGCSLTVMETGEHWFHTEEQLEVLRKWEEENLFSE